VKPILARTRIIGGRVNASARKTTSGCSALTAAISHSQNRTGLVWGLSTRKIRTPWAIQWSRTPLQASYRAGASGLSKFSG
jgi:hypothetical protein